MLKTMTLDFTITGKKATIFAEFGENPAQPIAMLRLQYGDYHASGLNNVKDCLGESYDPLIGHLLATREAG